MYFSLTTLTTTGLGDFFPVTNEERLIYSFIMLGGVTVFSFFLGRLATMFDVITNLDSEFGTQGTIESFFVMIV